MKTARCMFIICMTFFVASCCFGQPNSSPISESEKAENAKEAKQCIERHRQLADQCYKSQSWGNALIHYQYIVPYMVGDVKADIQKKIIECKKKAVIEEENWTEKEQVKKQVAEKERLEKQRIKEEKERVEAENQRIKNEGANIIIGVGAIILIVLLVFAIRFVNSFNAKSEANKAKTQSIANIVAVGLAVIIMFSMFFSCMQGSKSTGSSIDDAKVFVWAQDFVRARLDCPSTARFPSLSSGIVKNLGNNIYGYAGYVDSQNVYGAMVRSKYYVEIEFTGDECRLLNITIE